jgi:hypothetical protein
MDRVKAEILCNSRHLGDARPAVVGLAQERAEADWTGGGGSHVARSLHGVGVSVTRRSANFPQSLRARQPLHGRQARQAATGKTTWNLGRITRVYSTKV